MTLFKKQHDLLSYLETIHLDDSVEQAMVERAISQLKRKPMSTKLLWHLQPNFAS